VNSLVEWPVVYPCHFEEAFLAVPQECLILTMQTNQKYFALTDAAGHLRNRFLIVSNLATDTPQSIITGNERVVRPRLADAKFFFDQDRKKTLASRVPLLANVVYHNKIGSQLDRVQRLQQIAGHRRRDERRRRPGRQGRRDARRRTGQGRPADRHGRRVPRAARHDGHVLRAPRRRSRGRRPGLLRTLPPALCRRRAAAGNVAPPWRWPTSWRRWSASGASACSRPAKDPFALRRHALGILRMLIEKPLALSLNDVLGLTEQAFAGIAAVKPSREAITDFLFDRVRGYLKDKGYTTNEVEAVVSLRPQRCTTSWRAWKPSARSPRCLKPKPWPPPTSASRTS
jgi:glycyl-tRNA synthetase beta chain